MKTGGSTFKLLALLGIAAVAGIYLSYGTISPCGMLREQIRKADGLAAVLPDSLVDAVIAGKLGSLTPGRCTSALLGGTASVPPQVISAPPRSIPASVTTNLDSKIEAATTECRARRLKGELKNYRESTLCSNDKIATAFRDSGYAHMDLIAEFNARRIAIAEKIDRNKLTEAQGQEENRRLFLAVAAEEQRRSNSAASAGH